MSKTNEPGKPDTEPGMPETLTALVVANIFIGLLLVTFAAGFMYVEFVDKPTPSTAKYADRYAEEAKERLAKHSEIIEQELMSLASDTVPPITNAVYEQTRRDFPKYVHVLEREGEIFLSSVEQIFIRQVKAQYREYLQVHRQVLKEEFPQYTSEENIDRVMKEFEQTFDRIVERYYLEEFRREAKQTEALWAAIEPLPLPGPNEPSLHEQLADYSSDWTMLAFAETSDEQSAPDEASPEEANP